jgi:hypothetical protein
MSKLIYALAQPHLNAITKIPFCGNIIGGSLDMHLLEHPLNKESHWCLKSDCFVKSVVVLTNNNVIANDYKYETNEDDSNIKVTLTELKTNRQKVFNYCKPKYDIESIFQIFNHHSDETFKEMFPKERKK